MIFWKLVRKTRDRRYISVTSNKIQNASLEGRALSKPFQERNGRKEKEEKPKRWGGGVPRGEEVEKAINKEKPQTQTVRGKSNRD